MKVDRKIKRRITQTHLKKVIETLIILLGMSDDAYRDERKPDSTTKFYSIAIPEMGYSTFRFSSYDIIREGWDLMLLM